MRQKILTFWNQTALRIGHTGYQNQMIYDYDQPIRIKAIKKIIDKQFPKTSLPLKALDVGCGSGDFIQLLLDKKISTINAIDLSDIMVDKASSRFSDNSKVNIKVMSLEMFSDKKDNYDLIICITVLQHIVDDQKLKDALAKFYKILKPSGVLITLDRMSLNRQSEIFSEDSFVYLKTRSEKSFKSMFLSAGLSVSDQPVLPQLGISLNFFANEIKNFLLITKNKLLRNKSYVKPKLVNRNNQSANVKLPGLTATVIQRIILTISKPLDYWLALPLPPKHFRLYGCYVLTKTVSKLNKDI